MKITLSVLIFLQMSFNIALGQSSIVSSGGDAQGNGGTAAYSLGQVAYTSNSSNSGTINEGVQQAFEIFVTTGIDEIGIKLEMVVYPNPTSDFLILEVKEYLDADLRYELTDIKGNSLFNKNLTGPKSEINLTELANATYFLTVYNRSQILKTFKIIKNN